MAQQQFTILQNHLLAASSVVGGIAENGMYDLYTSSNQNNNNALPSCRLVIDYSNLTPGDIPGGITAVVEAMNGSNWFPIAYQFEPFRNADQGSQRILHLGPGIDTYNDGIDSIVYVGNRTTARISRQQGRAGSAFRVKLRLEEAGYGTPFQFDSVRVSVYGELFDDAG